MPVFKMRTHLTSTILEIHSIRDGEKQTRRNIKNMAENSKKEERGPESSYKSLYNNYYCSYVRYAKNLILITK